MASIMDLDESHWAYAYNNPKTVSLPNGLKNWPMVRDHLQQIVDGKVVHLEDLELILREIENREELVQRCEDTLLCITGLRQILLSSSSHFKLDYFLKELVPWMARKALDVETLFERPEVKTLGKMKNLELTLSRHQACCILTHAFFGTLPFINENYLRLSLVPFIEFNYSSTQKAKLVCMINYFHRMKLAEDNSEKDFLSLNITIERKALDDMPEECWLDCSSPLTPFVCYDEGSIEECHGDLQVHFSSSYIGGGVLYLDSGKEEIRFLVNPECLTALLFCECLRGRDAILFRGTEQFTSYTGYGMKFRYAGPHKDLNPVDPQGRRCISIVAIDALPFPYAYPQFGSESKLRELIKAYCGFSFTIPGDEKEMKPVATGNWGCELFEGNKELKSLIQWMAASRAGRPVKFFVSDDNEFLMALNETVQTLQKKIKNVGQLFRIVLDLEETESVFETVVAAAMKL